MKNWFLGYNSRGFTLQELLIVLFVVVTMLTLGIGNLYRSQQQASLQARLQSITADIRGQQIKAMTGEVIENEAVAPYGIHFENDRYVLFRGMIYDQADSANLEIELEDTLAFDQITFPSSSLQFSSIHGMMLNYSAAQNEVILKDTSTGETKTISINKNGVIYEVE